MEIQEDEMKKKPVSGMKDILPKEMAIREYVIKVIEDTYALFGFSRIETPIMESIENLSSKQGGENEKLIFKILKRGEKLNIDEAKEENDLVDAGLRYDLTVPLARYYSNHTAELPSPFKALQIGSVFRADRPQRGRFRQFTQCDIDIIGEEGEIAEIELVTATSKAVSNLGFKNYSIRINDRRLLKAMAISSGFAEDKLDEVFITLDKMDKIGLDGVRDELIAMGNYEAIVDKYLELFNIEGSDEEIIRTIIDKTEGGAEAGEGLIRIMDAVKAGSDDSFKIVFDPTLVRGMSYYTGPIFEIHMDEFGGSVGGGGRYDEMIGRFSGTPAPACGFSIGFERIILLLMESGFDPAKSVEKVALLIGKDSGAEGMKAAFAKAGELRAEGKCVTVAMAKKNKRFQRESLEAEGFGTIIDF